MALRNRLLIPGLLLSGVIAFTAVVSYSCVSRIRTDEGYLDPGAFSNSDDMNEAVKRYESLIELGKNLTNENRLIQESALRSIWWFVYDTPGTADMIVTVKDKTNGIWNIRDIDQTFDPSQFTVSLTIYEINESSLATNYYYSASFVPLHINNLYILLE